MIFIIFCFGTIQISLYQQADRGETIEGITIGDDYLDIPTEFNILPIYIMTFRNFIGDLSMPNYHTGL